MASNPRPTVNSPPPKPWEQAGSSSGPTPFKPPTLGRTSDVVEASGTAKPGEIVSTAYRSTTMNANDLPRLPTRAWEQQMYRSSYGGYGSNVNYNSGCGSGMYGSYDGYGGTYGRGLNGNNMYRGGYGGFYGGSGLHGGGMYNGGFGGPMGSYGMGMGGPNGNQDPNNPFSGPPSPPSFWISLLRVLEGVVNFFGRVSILIAQNTQAFHMFISAVLQLFDRSGMLYGELARFVLRLLGIRTKPKSVHSPVSELVPGPHQPYAGQNYIEGPKAAPSGARDNEWEESDHR